MKIEPIASPTTSAEAVQFKAEAALLRDLSDRLRKGLESAADTLHDTGSQEAWAKARLILDEAKA